MEAHIAEKIQTLEEFEQLEMIERTTELKRLAQGFWKSPAGKQAIRNARDAAKGVHNIQEKEDEI